MLYRLGRGLDRLAVACRDCWKGLCLAVKAVRLGLHCLRDWDWNCSLPKLLHVYHCVRLTSGWFLVEVLHVLGRVREPRPE